jgi:hypothetical protein
MRAWMTAPTFIFPWISRSADPYEAQVPQVFGGTGSDILVLDGEGNRAALRTV